MLDLLVAGIAAWIGACAASAVASAMASAGLSNLSAIQQAEAARRQTEFNQRRLKDASGKNVGDRGR